MKFRDLIEDKIKCPKCKGKGCDHCNDTGYHEKEEVKEAVAEVNASGIGYVISYTLHFAAQAHLWHLLCPNGQKHVALGELYEELQDEVDELAEKFIAQGGELQTVSMPLVAVYDEGMVRNRIDEFRRIVTSAIDTNPAMASIVDGVTDLQEVIDSKLYKFNLS